MLKAILPSHFKLSTIVMALLSVSATSVYAMKIQEGVHYRDFVTSSKDIEIDLERDNTGPFNFYFHEGAKVVSGLNTLDIIGNTDVTEKTSVNFYVDEGKSLHLESSAGYAIDSKNPLIEINFEAKGADLTFVSNAYDSPNDAMSIAGGNVNVTAHSMTTMGGWQSGLFLSSGHAAIRLTGDYVGKNGDAAIAGQHGSAEIFANNIVLSTTADQHMGINSGIYVSSYQDPQSKGTYIDLRAVHKMDISGSKNGIKTFGASEMHFEAEDIAITGDQNDGIKLNGYGSDYSSHITATAKNDLTVQGRGQGIYLLDKSSFTGTANTVNILGNNALWLDDSSAKLSGNNVTISGKAFGAYLKADSKMGVDQTNELTIRSEGGGGPYPWLIRAL